MVILETRAINLLQFQEKCTSVSNVSAWERESGLCLKFLSKQGNHNLLRSPMPVEGEP
jgi:hypothetical protein